MFVGLFFCIISTHFVFFFMVGTLTTTSAPRACCKGQLLEEGGDLEFGKHEKFGSRI